jgi:hypothetical protein
MMTPEETLEAIKAAPQKISDEQLEVLRLIDSLKNDFDPSAILMLQIESALKHYNLNKKPEDAPRTMADAPLMIQKSP